MMNVRVATVLLIVALAGLTGLAPQEISNRAPAQTFGIDAVHSTAIFRVQHLGAGMFYGRFNDLSGTFTFNEEDADGLAFDVTIDVDSVDSNNDNLDNHLKSPDFFNAKEHGTMSFRSSSAKKVGDRAYDVTGTLTIRGTSRPLTARMEWTGAKDSGPRMGYRCGFETTFTIKRSAFGILYGIERGSLGDETRVIVSLEGIRQ